MSWKEGTVEVGDVQMSMELQGTKWVFVGVVRRSMLKGLKEMTEFGYASAIPVQLLNIPKNPQNEVVIQTLSDEEVEEEE